MYFYVIFYDYRHKNNSRVTMILRRSRDSFLVVRGAIGASREAKVRQVRTRGDPTSYFFLIGIFSSCQIQPGLRYHFW